MNQTITGLHARSPATAPATVFNQAPDLARLAGGPASSCADVS